MSNIKVDKSNNSNQSKSNIQNRAKSKNKIEKYNKSSKDCVVESTHNNYLLAPLLFVLCIIPMIVHLKIYNPNLSEYVWFDNSSSMIDFFLYYKQWTLVITAAFMLLIIAYLTYLNRRRFRILPIFIPVAVYALLVLLSTLFSNHISFSLGGSFEQFESGLALIGYCIIVLYSYLSLKSERDFKIIIVFIIGAALLMSMIGISQILGHDFFSTDLGLDLILPNQYREGAKLNFAFGEKRVYLTLYNPNYVGVYVTIILPILIVIAILQQDMKLKIFAAVTIAGLLICAFGSQSLTFLISLGVAFFFGIIFLRGYLIKHYYITLPVIALLVILLIITNIMTDNKLSNKFANIFKTSNKTYSISEIQTNDDNVSIVYKGNKMYIQYLLKVDSSVDIRLLDENNEPVANNYDETTHSFQFNDPRFAGLIIGTDNETYTFYINADGRKWQFSNLTGDGTYYYLNSKGKYDKIVTAPSAVFTSHETFASNRGYIWSRTIPLLKNYIFLGSGPDTFVMAFPQRDYLNLAYAGFGKVIITKPHNLFLQIAVQTGVLSLISFLVFYGMYFVASFRLYIKGIYNSYYAKIGLAIFISTIAYMVSGLTNDSSITTAPIFWTFMGLGIAANRKAKAAIINEVVEAKDKKQNNEDL